MTYYKHELSDEYFETIEKCREDLLDCVDLVEIAEKLEGILTIEEILNNFLVMDKEEFYDWLLEKYWYALSEIQEDLISEVETDEEEDE